MDGVKDTFRYFWLTVRSSIVGALVGMFPGVGGGVAQWIAYAQATHSAKSREDMAGLAREISESHRSRGSQQLQGGGIADSFDCLCILQGQGGPFFWEHFSFWDCSRAGYAYGTS